MSQDLAADVLQERVFMFTAIQSHVDRKKLTPMTRLAQDLDITGDDASEFFDVFGKAFRVNLDELNMHWDRHFRPEAGFLLNAVCIVLGFVTLAGSLLLVFRFGGFLWSYDYFSPFQMYRRATYTFSAFASLLCWFLVWNRNRLSVPVTVADLIDAADAGRWVKPYGRV
jgi:hypothetical protein